MLRNPGTTPARRLHALRGALLIALALAGSLAQPPLGAAAPSRSPLPIGSRLYDLGVADLDGDGRLDIFGTAHENAARSLLSRGHRRFRAAPGSLGFGEDGGFPGLGNTKRRPEEKAPGTYVYVHRVDEAEKDLYVRIDAHRSPANVELTLAPRRNVKDVRVRRGELTADNDGHRSAGVEVRLERNGHARFRVNLDLPVAVRSSGRTFVGAKAIPAAGDEFRLRLADAHADVFADLDGDDRDDLIRVVGGLGGGIAKPRLRGQVHDVTRRWTGDRYEDIDLDLKKEDCRGRQGAALDIDGDGGTDLFEGCAGGDRRKPARPIVQLARPDGSFRRETVPARGEIYRWVAAPGVRRPALLVLGARATLWTRSAAGWKRVAATRLRGRPTQTTLGDFDGDARPEVYVSSLRSSTLVRLGKRRMRSQNPRRYGLPASSDAAAWVDADGDGALDLHSVPGGLFMAHGRHFRATGRLAAGGRYAHLSWADFDNNGLREPIFAQTDGEFTIDSRGWWYGPHPLRRHPRRPWLEVVTPGNWLTARIVVEPDRGRRRIGWAGEAETSRFSQGHNRVYFTLPQRARHAWVRVRTSDGELHRLRTEPNRIADFGG